MPKGSDKKRSNTFALSDRDIGQPILDGITSAPGSDLHEPPATFGEWVIP
jgi:hypothetical protein